MSEHTYPAVSCRVCNDTGTVWSPDPDGCSVYESACPEPIHEEMAHAAHEFTEDRQAMEREGGADGTVPVDVTFPADANYASGLDTWDF
jgi:hypothetical protein